MKLEKLTFNNMFHTREAFSVFFLYRFSGLNFKVASRFIDISNIGKQNVTPINHVWCARFSSIASLRHIITKTLVVITSQINKYTSMSMVHSFVLHSSCFSLNIQFNGKFICKHYCGGGDFESLIHLF